MPGEPIHTKDVTQPKGPADSRNRAAIQQFVGEMIALESQIEAAMDSQLRLPLQHPRAVAAIPRFHDMVKRQRDSLKTHLAALGGSEAHPVQDAVAKLFGKAASVIQSVRSEAVSTVLRDDYLTFNHAAIAYSMLHTAAHALGDMATMEIADRHLRGYAAAVQEINQLMPDVVVWELELQDFTANRGAVEHCTAAINRAWRDTAPGDQQEESTVQTGGAIRRAA